MNDYPALVTEDQRLRILSALQADSAYSHNEDVLLLVLVEAGHTISADKLRTELTWLAEQGMVRLIKHGDLYVAQITRRGMDVAGGAVSIPGIAQPRPN